MVEDDDVAIEQVVHIGGIVLRLRFILYGNILEVAYSIKRCVSVESAIV